MNEQFVLVHEATGDEYIFDSRAEYLNAKAQGGYRDKDEESSAPQQQRTQVTPVPARQSEPTPAPADRPVKPEPPHA